MDTTILERATNQLLIEVSSALPDMLRDIDILMASEDDVMKEILGAQYASFPTPQPSTWRLGSMPLFTGMPVTDYPSVTCWGHEKVPAFEDGASWGYSRGHMLVQAALLASDTTFLARFCYRYAAAIQAIVQNTTLGGLCEPASMIGQIDMSVAQFREHDDINNAWYAQSVMYRFNVEFLES